jgi:hypothetical protein
MRLLSVLLFASAAIAAGVMLTGAFCTSVGEKDEVVQVPVERLDLAGAELTIEDLFNLRFENDYPAVVATVNGEEISGDALSRQQVSLELSRRSADRVDENLGGATSYADELAAQDPLEALIDETLKHQAIERLGLLPSDEEAIEYTREQEESFRSAVVTNPENREQTLEFLRMQGFPESDWASSENVVEGYGWSMAMARLLNDVCRNATEVRGYVNTSTSHNCDAFIAAEREDADIVYYVRWADE